MTFVCSSSTTVMGDAHTSYSTSSAVPFTAVRTNSCHLSAKEQQRLRPPHRSFRSHPTRDGRRRAMHRLSGNRRHSGWTAIHMQRLPQPSKRSSLARSSQRTYADHLVDHLRWLAAKGYREDSITIQDLLRYFSLCAAYQSGPLGTRWRATPLGESARAVRASGGHIEPR